MYDLTLKEIIILVVVLSLIISLIVAFFKHSMKLALVGLVIMILFTGFTWLPEKVKQWVGQSDGEIEVDPNMQYDNLDETLNDVGSAVGGFINENKDSWIEAAKSLWAKIQGKTDTPQTDENISTGDIS